MENRVKETGNILVAASSVFFLETSFEMYVLTLRRGPQMLFYPLAHGSSLLPPLLVALSGVAFICLAAFALVVVISGLAGKARSSGRYPRFLLIVLCVQVIHTALIVTYDRWASALFADGGV